VNAGKEPHYALFVRLTEGKHAADFLSWRRSGTALPSWAALVSGPAPVAPGDSTDVLLTLPAGHYVVLCSYPTGGGAQQHVDLGMARDLDVVDRHVDTADPPASITLELSDSAFRLSSAIHAGPTVVTVENRGTRVQQALITRLRDGVALPDELHWFDSGFHNRRPGIPSGGVLRVEPGERYLIRRTFTPGRYALLSHASGPWQTLEFVVR